MPETSKENFGDWDRDSWEELRMYESLPPDYVMTDIELDHFRSLKRRFYEEC